VSTFKTKAFARFARKAGLTDAQLALAAEQVVAGHFDADLGGGVYKQRVARSGGGKSGGFRTLLAFRAGRSCYFVYGFAKNAKANLTPRELEVVRGTAAVLLGYDGVDLVRAVENGELMELEL
jgi:hypothetical protein